MGMYADPAVYLAVVQTTHGVSKRVFLLDFAQFYSFFDPILEDWRPLFRGPLYIWYFWPKAKKRV